MLTLHGLFAFELVCYLTVTLLLVRLFFDHLHRRTQETSFNGPPSPSWLFGVSKLLAQSSDSASLYERWSEKYGLVYTISATLGKSCLVLCDPKAVQHFYSGDTYGYVQTSATRALVKSMFGHCVLWAEGATHKRHRKALVPAFSPAAIKAMLPIFYDSAHKVKSAWDSILAAEAPDSNSTIIDVQEWMNRASFDTFGIAGFGHDFGTLRGEPSTIFRIVDAFITMRPGLAGSLQIVLGLVFPWTLKLPTAFRRLGDQLDANLGEIAREVLASSRTDEGTEGNTGDRSIMGVLLRAEKSDSQMNMSTNEILAQMKVMMIAGYITTANCLMWCLVELAQKPELQNKLRQEVSQIPCEDATWDQLVDGLPYLDAVIHETLRLHPPMGETTRVATADDIIPLSYSTKTATGAVTDRISVSKGQLITVPIHTMNTSCRFWGSNAKEFHPERFLGDKSGIMKDLPGHKHILTFVYGPRMCYGRNFAITEMKAMLAVLVCSFAFEMVDGPNAEVGVIGGLLSVPVIADGDGKTIPLRVRRLE